MGAFATGLKYTAFGCLGLILFVALSVGIVGFLAVKQADATPVEESASEWSPPAEIVAVDLPDADTDPAPGVISLHLSSGTFEIEPAAAGEGLSIDASYRPGNFELVEEFIEGDGDEPWRYNVRFEASKRSMMTVVQSLMGKNKAELKLRIPPDLPYRLEILLDGGGMSAELGGLWLTDLDLKVGKGGGAVTFDRPLREPMQSMSVDVRFGGLAVAQLVNAAPRELSTAVNMGGADISMRGEWPHDTRMSIYSKSGGLEIRLPDNVRVEGVPEALYRSRVPDNPEIPAPVLRFSSDSVFDDVQLN